MAFIKCEKEKWEPKCYLKWHSCKWKLETVQITKAPELVGKSKNYFQKKRLNRVRKQLSSG